MVIIFYKDIKQIILDSKGNSYEKQNDIKTLSVKELKKEEDIAFFKGLKSDGTATLFVAIKINKKLEHSWFYFAPSESHIGSLKKDLPIMYDDINSKNEFCRNYCINEYEDEAQ